jgi:ribosomal protein S18 acetylase RimI-like enzyme
MPDAFSIRPCRADECEQVLDIWRRSDALPTVTDDLVSIRRVVSEGPATLLVAEADGAMVGTIIAGWDGWRGTIYRLAVLPEQRRRGVARALVEASVRWHRAHGARRTVTYTHLDEPHAMAFWRSLTDLGFEEIADNRRFVLNLPDADV